MWEITYTYLVDCSVHIGHSIKNSSPLCAWMVLAKRQQTLLINLYKWTFIMQRGVSLINRVVQNRAPVWFISLDPIKSDVVKLAAQYCGEFYIVSGWISGLLSNYAQLCLSWSRNRLLIENARPNRQRRLAEIYDNWMLSRISWPRAVFLCGVEKSYRVARETLAARIPCIALADTVGGHQALSIAVPANDDTMDSIYFHNFFICKNILQEKFSIIFQWFYYIRSYDRLADFNKWFSFRGLSTKNQHSSGRFLPLGKVSSILFSQPRMLGSKAMLTALTRMSSGTRNKLPGQRIFLYSKGTEEGEPSRLWSTRDSEQNLDKYTICNIFINNNLLYSSLLKLRFLSCVEFSYTPAMQTALNMAYESKAAGFSSRKQRTYLTGTHQLFDLLNPDHRGNHPESSQSKDYLFKKALASSLAKEFMESGAFGPLLQKILTSYFLVIGLFSRNGFTVPTAYLQKKNYRKAGLPFKRLQKNYKPILNYGFKKTSTSFRKELSYTRQYTRGVVLKNIFHVFLGRLVQLTGSMFKLPSTTIFSKDLIYSRINTKTTKLYLNHGEKEIPIATARFYSKLPLFGKRSYQPLSYFRDVKTFANKIYWRYPLLKKMHEEAMSRPEPYYLFKKTNIRAKDYTYFMHNYWNFGSSLLADIFWGWPLQYMAGGPGSFNKTHERAFYQSQAYPLFKQSAFLLKSSR